MHKRGLISFPFAGRLRTFQVPATFWKREHAKSKLEMFSETMFVVCLYFACKADARRFS